MHWAFVLCFQLPSTVTHLTCSCAVLFLGGDSTGWIEIMVYSVAPAGFGSCLLHTAA